MYEIFSGRNQFFELLWLLSHGWLTGIAVVVDKGFFFWDSAHMDPVWRTLAEKAS